MHIAMIGQKGIPAHIGGIERHVEELSTRLSSLGARVTVYTRPWYTPVSKKRLGGVRLVSLSSLQTKYFDAISHTFKATLHAMRSDADILHYHGVGPALLSWIPRLFAPEKRVITTFHCIDRRHEKWSAFGRAALLLGEFAACKFAHETITVSRTLQHYVENVYRTDVRYIPNGVATHGAGSRHTLARMGLKPQSYLLVVTRFVRHKGVHTILASWEKLQKLPQFKNLRLVLVGGGSFGDSYAEVIREYAGRLLRVHLLGVKEGEELAALYRHARLFLHASVSEGLPIVLLEAMGHGAPVLASDIPEHMELIAEYGWRFKAQDPKSLSREIRAVLAEPLRMREKSEKAKRWVNREFAWDDIAKETLRLYEQAMLVEGEKVAVTV